MVGFCGGGYQSVLLSTKSKDVKAVVAFYAPPVFSEQYQLANDRKPNLMDLVTQIKVPIQGHYGMSDPIIPVEDVRRFACLTATEHAGRVLFLRRSSSRFL